MTPNALRELQEGIADFLIDVEDGDSRWFQLHVMLLLRGVDVMDTAAHLTTSQISAAKNVGHAVSIARDAAVPPARLGNGSAVEWAMVGALVALALAAVASVVLSGIRK